MADESTHKQDQPRIFYGWNIVGAGIITNAIIFAGYLHGFSVFIIPIEREFGWSRSVISGALSLRQVESGVLTPILGFVVDRVGPRRLIIACALVTGTGLIALAQVNNVVTFYLAFLLIAAGTGGLAHGLSWPIIISRWFHRRRGLATGIVTLGPLLAAPFVILNAQMEAQIGWRTVVLAYGILCLVVVTAIGVFVVRDRPEPYGVRPDGDPPTKDQQPQASPQRQGVTVTPDSGLTVREVLRDKRFWMASIHHSGLSFAMSFVLSHQVPYFIEDIGFPAATAAATFTMVVLISGFGRVGFGALMDRYDYRLVLWSVSACMVASFVYLQLADISSLWHVLPFAALYGWAFGCAQPLRATLVSKLFGTRSMGSVIGLMHVSSVATSFMGPIMAGVMFDWQGNYYLAIWIITGLTLATSFSVFMMRQAGPKVPVVR